MVPVTPKDVVDLSTMYSDHSINNFFVKTLLNAIHFSKGLSTTKKHQGMATYIELNFFIYYIFGHLHQTAGISEIFCVKHKYIKTN